MNRIIHFAFGILLVFLISLAGAHGPAVAQPFQSQQLQGSAARQFLARAGILDQIAPLEPVVEARGRNYLEPRPADYSPLRSRDQFGHALVLAGDTLLVGALYANEGANSDQGAVYSFTRDTGELNAWSQQQRFTAADGAAADFFGGSVALAGDTAVIGAPGDDVGGNVDQGSAYVFVFDGQSWSEQAKLTAGDGAAGDTFGASVSVSGDTALVGAPGDDVGANADQGSAYIFERAGNGAWSERQKLTAGSGAQHNHFGGSVALDGDTALIGADRDDVAGNTDQGSAFIFARSGGLWSEQQRLIAGDGEAGDHFGGAVALDSYTALIGADGDDVGTKVDQGSAYVFARNAAIGESAVWSEQQKLLAADGKTGDEFGTATALAGNTVVIGAWLGDGAPWLWHTNQGSAYLFTRDSGSMVWSAGQRLAVTAGAPSDTFGAAVAIEGDTIAVGAPGVNLGELPDTGRVYTTVRGPTPWPETGTIVAEGGVQYEVFGTSVALDGDTALIGARWADSAFVFVRIGGVWIQQQRLFGGEGFGGHVALDGDTALIGAVDDDVGGNTDQGSVSVYVRGADGSAADGGLWSLQQKLFAEDGAAYDNYGRSVALDGDTAIVLGSPTEYHGGAYVYKRNGSVWSVQQILTVEGTGPGEGFQSVALDGDTALLGRAGADIGANERQGAAYVFVRNGAAEDGDIWSQQQKLTASDGAAFDYFGMVALDGDTAVIGAPGRDLAIYVFVYDGSIWTEQQQLNVENDYDEGYYYIPLAVDGDIILTGNQYAHVGANYEQGWAHVYVRRGSVWVWDQKLLPANGAPGMTAMEDQFGSAVALDGEIALVGAWWADVNGNVNQGRAHFFERGASEVFWSYLPAALKP